MCPQCLSPQEIHSQKKSVSCILFFNYLFRLMASLTPPLPSALTSILSTLLPCGFAVGPSRFCEGRLGLWWVGCMLKPGSLLGRDGNLKSSSVHQSERMKSETTVCCDSETTLTGCTEETKASLKKNQDFFTFHDVSELNYIFNFPLWL